MDRRLSALVPALLATSACGDNGLPTGLPLAETGDVAIVAHQDDDLLFMQPDVAEAVRAGGGMTIVYVTAGNGTKGYDRSQGRYQGLMEAYGDVANATAWTCGWIAIAGHTAEHCRLAERNVSLVFLAYPDGGKRGEYEPSLRHLWQGDVASVETIAERTAVYDRPGLIDTVADVLRETRPAHVHVLDGAGTHGYDHNDHMLVGGVALLAVARANVAPDLIAYRGYNTPGEPPNKREAMLGTAKTVLGRYEACATDCAPCGDVCSVGGLHLDFLLRRYAIGFRPTFAGRLRQGTSCLLADGALGDCSAAPVWKLDELGQLRSGLTCLAVADDGTVSGGVCTGGVERRFFVDDEGHIWSGLPPRPEPGIDYAQLRCLRPDAGRVTAQLCGGSNDEVTRTAPTWEIAPPTKQTARADLGLTATGRDVRLGDLTGDGRADLCAVENGGLRCAPGDGQGGFAPSTLIDDPIRPLAIEPRSLALGDVDGDGALDACGRDANGILCATATSGFTAVRWSPAFNDQLARPTTAASISIVDANADGNADICGVDLTGVVCAPRGLMLKNDLRSAWPIADAVVWSADLDGDRQADWCAATDTGPACAVAAERGATDAGAPWGYAQGGVVDVAPANNATVAIADIDGDGRADLCSPREDRIVCARSQGRAFGPRAATLAVLPNQATASALWLGDLNGDGRADPCVDAGTSIICAVAP